MSVSSLIGKNTFNLITHIIIVKIVAIIPILTAISVYNKTNSKVIQYITIILASIIIIIQIIRAIFQYRSVTSILVVLFMLIYALSLLFIGIFMNSIEDSNRLWIAIYLIVFSHLFEIVDIIDFRISPFKR
ncbi:MAG: hypothetical protein CMG46_00160 [Candidatus Marinimicrobia bacterium]|nr:hypothetical protein [Candidatus Neomarinimicrobiota bacterium]|tara:strand:+ start:2284 stop:2676 length:393 start_codon:yes stop_codon:yes gene_type:complete